MTSSKGFFFFFYCRWKLSSWIKSPFLENKKVEPHHINFFSFLFSLTLSLTFSYCSSLHESNRKGASSIKSRNIFGNKIRFRNKGKKKKAILKMSVLSRLVGWEGWVPKPNFSCIYIIGCVCIRGCKMVFWI